MSTFSKSSNSTVSSVASASSGATKGTTRASSTRTAFSPAPAVTASVTGEPSVVKVTRTRWKYCPCLSSDAVALTAIEESTAVVADPSSPAWWAVGTTPSPVAETVTSRVSVGSICTDAHAL